MLQHTTFWKPTQHQLAADEVHIRVQKSNTASTITNNDFRIYKFCGLVQDTSKASYQHTKLGLDEAPDLLVCLRNFKDFKETVLKSLVDAIEPVLIFSVPDAPSKEMERRMCGGMSKLVSDAIVQGILDHGSRSYGESGCSAWVESFSGRAVKPQHVTRFSEYSPTCEISQVEVKVIARCNRHGDEDGRLKDHQLDVAYHQDVVLRLEALHVGGQVHRSRRGGRQRPGHLQEHLHPQFGRYEGLYLLLQDGYVTCFAGSHLYVINYSVNQGCSNFESYNKRPDTVVAEVMINSDLIVIENLSSCGTV
ncbi:hypothetical protein CkaCkLH20_02001 [Colletotrichum karsti]|uniref:Uncharacterized protein n=1 Tax=Colletotrichum karsti TaxID=1095194 RepID=A0A9P6IEH6_9PEZI|nr:uncharacterized protein CkaCkLH20_02001 [Colletotrichum karsti]KAF9880959.1 hypothetical protein CkaCkLH20_02001 [Colletotrichum karsti]